MIIIIIVAAAVAAASLAAARVAGVLLATSNIRRLTVVSLTLPLIIGAAYYTRRRWSGDSKHLSKLLPCWARDHLQNPNLSRTTVLVDCSDLCHTQLTAMHLFPNDPCHLPKRQQLHLL